MSKKKAEELAQRICDAGYKAYEQDGSVYISAESGDNAADYYGEFQGGYPWINPSIVRMAKQAKAVLDWKNAGCVVAEFGLMDNQYVIYSSAECARSEGEAGYWSNEHGWTAKGEATRYTEDEKQHCRLPVIFPEQDAQWLHDCTKSNEQAE